MQRSGSQKALLVISIITIVFAALGLLGAIAGIVGGAAVDMANTPEMSDAFSGSGVTQQQVGGILVFASLVVLLACAFELVVGILGVRAANDNQKIMPVWVLAIIDVVLNAISLIMTIVNSGTSSSILSTFVSLALGVVLFWIANNIKREAGK